MTVSMPSESASIEAIIQQNIDCYNRRDLDGFMETFARDVELYTFGEHVPATSGFESMKDFYQNLFDQSPNLHSTILRRIVFDNKVIDHESISGRLGSTEPIELVAIYEVRDGKIFRLTAIRTIPR